MSEANGTPKALLEYRRMMLQAHGLDTKLAESMTGRLRTEVAVEVRELARQHKATPPEPPEGDGEADTDDSAELARRHGRRHRF